MESICLITNNALFSSSSLKNPNIEFEIHLLASSALNIFISGRNLIHLDWELLNHPLYGNFRQGEQPFRSLLLRINHAKSVQNNTCNSSFSQNTLSSNAISNQSTAVQDGLNFIEQAIHWYTPFADKLPTITSKVHEETRKIAEDTMAKTSNYYTDCAILDRELMRKTLEIVGIYIP